MKKIIKIYIRFVQKILITLLLTVLYFIGFGLTWVYSVLFKRGMLYGRCRNDESFWLDIKEQEPNLQNSIQQS
jgi:hypothetical protein